MINKENIEAYILQLIDGELDSKTHAAVMQYVASHKEAADLLAEYEACKLMPDETLVYENKLELYAIANADAPTQRKKRGAWMPLSIAASVAALIIIALIANNKNTSVDVAQTATPQAETPTTNNTISSEAIEVSNNTENTVVSVATENKKIEAVAPVRIDVSEKTVNESVSKNVIVEQNIEVVKKNDKQQIVKTKAKPLQEPEFIASTTEITKLSEIRQPIIRGTFIKMPVPVQIKRINAPINLLGNESVVAVKSNTQIDTPLQTKNTWLSKNIAFKKLLRAKETATEILASVNDVRKDGIVIDLDYSGFTRKQN
jgi:anti-sigma factor RsiW